MTEADKLRLIQLDKERDARYDKRIAVYKDLLDYWSNPHRMIGSSPRLNQSREFIQSQIDNAVNTLKSLGA